MVYFLRCEQDTELFKAGWVKIGNTIRLDVRLREITGELGHRPTVLGVMDGGYDEEQSLHRRFAEHRRFREWFEPHAPGLMELIAAECRPWDGNLPKEPKANFAKNVEMMRDTARRIRAERQRLGLTQVEAARRLGIPRPSYQLLEERANPLLGTMTDLVEVLGMDPEVLFPRLMSKFDEPDGSDRP